MILFWRSKVKGLVTGPITLHNNALFRTIIAFHSHSLGSDTSTITLQPRFVVIRYSLGGDTDKSNTAWVRTLCVHSSSRGLLWTFADVYCLMFHATTETSSIHVDDSHRGLHDQLHKQIQFSENYT